MTDRRIDVVAEMLSDHAWVWAVFGCDAEPVCEWTADTDDPELMNHQHDRHVAAMVIAALDADARTRPFIGTIPPERDFSDYRDRCGEVEEPEVTLEQAVAGVQATRHEGIGEFHKDTSHNPEA